MQKTEEVQQYCSGGLQQKATFEGNGRHNGRRRR
jgi:hypothetical protein